MYELKPLFCVPLEMQNTCSMYKLKNLQEKAINVFNKTDNDLNNDVKLNNNIEELLKRQNKVLNTLEQLEFRLSKIDINFCDSKESVNVQDKQCIVSTLNNVDEKIQNKSQFNDIIDIKNLIKTDTVIFANPEDPPYSLLALPILWPKISWNISYHIHSSIINNLKALELTKVFTNVSCKDNKNIIKVFVIWQQIETCLKIVRCSTDILYGEVSLLRLFNHYLDTEKMAADQLSFNKVMDVVHELTGSINDDNTKQIYNFIDDSNTKLNVENIAIWSLLYKKRQCPLKIKNWLEHFTKIIIS